MAQQPSILPFDNRQLHDALHMALPVHVAREGGEPVAYYDEGAFQANLYRGDQYGEGHADRLLDDFQGRVKVDKDFTCERCTAYCHFLRRERQYGEKGLPLTLRARLLATA